MDQDQNERDEQQTFIITNYNANGVTGGRDRDIMHALGKGQG
jgi:hypothetical protein